MVEQLREMWVKVEVYIDTNKATYHKKFDTMEEAQEYIDDILEGVI